MDNCKIIEDLLPSYCDGLTSEESNRLICDHTASCPSCKQLLEKMSSEPPREIIDHREQFRRKLKEYETNYYIKKLTIWLCGAVLVCFLLLLLCNSYGIAKWTADVKLDGKGTLVAQGIEVGSNSIEDYYLYSTAEGYSLVTLAKNKWLPFWYIASVVSSNEQDRINHAWFGRNTHRWFDGKWETDFEVNYLYIGSDAVSSIELTQADIPGDVLVKVNQQGKYYCIHVISDDTEAMNGLELWELLKEKGYIS